jgi:Zn-dependent M28 family amino/carboxypeptidase
MNTGSMLSFLVTLLIGCSLMALAQPNTFTPSADAQQAAHVITTNSILAPIRFLAHDLLEGRAPGTRGDVLARTFIASQMESIGLQPGGDDGTYFQRVPITAMKAEPNAVLSLHGPGRSLSLTFGKEFVAASGIQQPEVTVKDADVVFVGYGIVAPEQDWNDYKNVDVTGKVLLMLNNDPAPNDPNLFGGKARTYYGRWTYKYEIAAKMGAVGAIIIHTDESAGYGWNVIEVSYSNVRFELQSAESGRRKLSLKAWTTSDATKRMLALTGKSFEDLYQRAQRKTFQPTPLGLRVDVTIHNSIRSVETANVIGVLPGSDPVLQDEAVIYTAHHDHLGIGKPVAGDSIYNGALDNASGVSAILNIARAFTTMNEKPRRSIVIAAVGAEESGLLGSQFYTQNPTYPPGKLAANINIDGINTFGRTKDLSIIGMGKSSLDDVTKQVAVWQGRIVKPDPQLEQGYFYRSDQFNFAKIGVPALYTKRGNEFIGKPQEYGQKMADAYNAKHYHQPSDEVRDDWDLTGAVDDLRLLYFVGLTVANNDEMPRWTPGDEFEGIRLRSLGTGSAEE